ncbi:MAG: hypothetical protein FWC67_01190 [Defluviitaleaceae bacterium]|nr:hypothetical protein [Defluviitaleaceae bacterium]
MSEMLAEGRRLLEDFTQEQLFSAVTYMRFLHTQPTPLDDFDYEMARLADLDTCTETVSFDEVLRKAGLTYEDLQD